MCGGDDEPTATTKLFISGDGEVRERKWRWFAGGGVEECEEESGLPARCGLQVVEQTGSQARDFDPKVRTTGCRGGF